MAKRGGFPMGGMGGANMNNLMKQAQKMQRQMEEKQKEMEEKTQELAGMEMSASAGGGMVEVTVSGKKEVTKIKIDPEAVDPDDVEMLEDLIMAATNEALRKMGEYSEAELGKITDSMNSMAGGFPF